MARFNLELPTEIMDDIRKINDNADEIFGKMTSTAAEAVASNIRSAAPSQIPAHAIKTSRVYKTPSDDGINTKVYVTGYAPFKNGRSSFTRRGRATNDTQYSSGKGIPYEFLAQVYEYGTSSRFTNNGAFRGRIVKKPFFRKGFKKSQIEEIMKKVQLAESGGLLSDE